MQIVQSVALRLIAVCVLDVTGTLMSTHTHEYTLHCNTHPLIHTRQRKQLCLCVKTCAIMHVHYHTNDSRGVLTHTCAHARTHARTHTHTHTHTLARSLIHVHTCVQYMHTDMRVHTHAVMHACRYICINANAVIYACRHAIWGRERERRVRGRMSWKSQGG